MVKRLSNVRICIVACLVIVICLSGCAKLVSTEYQDVEVKIVDEYHRAMYMTPIKVGKTTTMQTHPAVYQITVEYQDTQYTINNQDIYLKYKDQIGQTATGVLTIRRYDDDSVLYDIAELK